VNIFRAMPLVAISCTVFLVGCAKENSGHAHGANDKSKVGDVAAAKVDEEKIKANLAKLSKEDKEAAEEQKYCAAETENRLGAMGVPIKITLKDKDGKDAEVFLCCKGCEKEAKKDVAATLARVNELKIQANIEQLSPEDQKLALAQRFCAKDNENRLGSMGPPAKVMLKDKDGIEHAVFVCCGGCAKPLQKDVEGTLKIVKELKEKNAKAATK